MSAARLKIKTAWYRVRPWWHCRHCGDQVFSFRCGCHEEYPVRRGVDDWELEEGPPRSDHPRRHTAHRHGEAHCEAPCPRWRRCRCVMLCIECDEPETAHAPDCALALSRPVVVSEKNPAAKETE